MPRIQHITFPSSQSYICFYGGKATEIAVKPSVCQTNDNILRLVAHKEKEHRTAAVWWLENSGKV